MQGNEFDKIIKNRIDTRLCKKCGSGCTIRVEFAAYGPTGAWCKCKNELCGAKTKMQGISEYITTADRCATPVTQKSLIKGIKKAIKQWNNGELLE